LRSKKKRRVHPRRSVQREIEGSAGTPYSSQTGNDGQATILFEMPSLQAPNRRSSFVRKRIGYGHLRFSCVRSPRSCSMIKRMSEAIQIHVNGNQATGGRNQRARFVEHLGLNPGRVAIEYNLEILPKTKWEQTKSPQATASK
jgi:thiamine biosynthesis protein ThiS